MIVTAWCWKCSKYTEHKVSPGAKRICILCEKRLANKTCEPEKPQDLRLD
jgi:hypothetical protein